MKVKLMCGDCLYLMEKIPNNSIDLTVTSPPYDKLRDYNGCIEQWSFEKFKAISKELYRVTGNGGVVVWVVADSTVNGSETGTSFKQALFFKSCGFRLHDTMIYMKDNPPPVGGANRYYQAFEYMFVLSKGSPKTFNPICEPRRNKWNDKRTVRVRPVTRARDGSFQKTVFPVNLGDVKLQNVWNYVVSGGSSATDRIAYQHPAIFPEQLAKDQILSWSNPGDTVFDPMMGSGTTGKMAVMTERDFIGIELDKEYYGIAKERIRKYYNERRSKH